MIYGNQILVNIMDMLIRFQFWIGFQSKRLKSYRQNNHNFYKNFDENFINNPDSLSNLQPRIAFRLISRSTDSRTLRACLVPPKTFHVHSSQLVNIFSKNKFDEAYLLGVLVLFLLIGMPGDSWK